MSVYLWCVAAIFPVGALAFVLFLDERIASRGWQKISDDQDRAHTAALAHEHDLPYLDEYNDVVWPATPEWDRQPHQYRFPL